MMRATGVLDERATAHCTSFDDALKQAPLGLQSLHKYLPPWLGYSDPCTQSLSQMLKVLKTVTESYLEASLSIAEVVVPFPVSKS